jgi:hypothetical protein
MQAKKNSVHFDTNVMRNHLLKCMEDKQFSPFPKIKPVKSKVTLHLKNTSGILARSNPMITTSMMKLHTWRRLRVHLYVIFSLIVFIHRYFASVLETVDVWKLSLKYRVDNSSWFHYTISYQILRQPTPLHIPTGPLLLLCCENIDANFYYWSRTNYRHFFLFFFTS